ncbi:macrophage migration inhibitory factor-like [Mizuhopecten yessoensis]|uniref:L-dopachrome isomerase n=1 Tax=Mizuhopecten yessoensis TaxID=6573 RepID=A0A210Q6E6_MIZYE|nr:macrophage migration inhibitory factor-like [Mizuhopecten yessoensis]OWF44291.1 Macrophage migration inhibitory factor [Mizuhopecten yessoensis]
MPIFTVYTNKSSGKEEATQFLLDASKFIASLLGKPEKYVTVRYHPDQLMSHGGTTDPCGSVELYSINLGTERNNSFAEAIGEFIATKLTIPKDRFYVNFTDLKRTDVAIDGKTFAT